MFTVPESVIMKFQSRGI